MKRYSPISALVCVLVLFVASVPALADWSPGDDHKMHSAQLPDKNGWDICLVHQGIADDFQCTETGPITDIHFWVSWKGDVEDFASVRWKVSIYDDASGRPGGSLWTLSRGDGNITYRPYGTGDQGWHCPSAGLTQPDDHSNYYQVNITEIQNYFEQTRNEKYWLLIQAELGESKAEVGWKTSTTSYHSKAYWLNSEGQWILIGGNVSDLAFVITCYKAVEIDQFDFQQEVELITPLGRELINTTGTTTMHVFFEGPDEGDAYDDDGNGRDEVELEIVDLSWTDTCPSLGLVELREHPSLSFRGEIEEVTDINTGTLDVPPFAPYGNAADMIMYFYFEVEFNGQVLCTNQPMSLSGRIVQKPPGLLSWFSNLERVNLIDANGVTTRSYIAFGHQWNGPVYEADPFELSWANIEVLKDGTVLDDVELSGFSSMYVLFKMQGEGYAWDGDGDGLDGVNTEIVVLDLAGSSPNLGIVNMRLAPDISSVGKMEELVNNTDGILDIPPFALEGSVDSFFDMFFELEIGGVVYHNEDPLRWTSTLYHKPPTHEMYESTVSVSLYDNNGQPSIYSLGSTRYQPGYCGDDAHPIPIGDFNLDCRVNFLDFAVFALHWLECTRPECP